MRDQERFCEATTIRADGVVMVKFKQNFLTNTTPAPISRWATPLDSAEEGSFALGFPVELFVQIRFPEFRATNSGHQRLQWRVTSDEDRQS